MQDSMIHFSLTSQVQEIKHALDDSLLFSEKDTSRKKASLVGEIIESTTADGWSEMTAEQTDLIERKVSKYVDDKWMPAYKDSILSKIKKSKGIISFIFNLLKQSKTSHSYLNMVQSTKQKLDLAQH